MTRPQQRLRASPPAAAFLALALLAPGAAAREDPSRPPTPPTGPVIAESTVGIEGSLIYRFVGESPLLTRPETTRFPIVLRIVSSTRDQEATLYDLRFIASRPGLFDLRRGLRRADGGRMLASETAVVRVGALLSDDHDGELLQTSNTTAPELGGYTKALIALGVFWALVPVALIARRLLRRPPAPPQPAPPPPSLADQLRPLVVRALDGSASIADRARLEMLLIGCWRERLSLAGVPHRSAVVALRAHPQAG
ncbi:MAG: hypothetical protein ACT4PL_08110, partial [Phycisphaerales bacterium]